MKKILFYAGLLALAAGCTDDTFDTVGGSAGKIQKNGITFVGTSGMPDTKIQYDWNETTQKWSPFWYAEQDSITIWASGVSKASDNSVASYFGYWRAFADNDGHVTKATYKATQSAKTANFTSIDDENTLAFTKENDSVSKFIAIYPANWEANIVRTSGKGHDSLRIENIFKGAGAMAKQYVTTLKGSNTAIVRVGISTSDPKNRESYNSVGEKVNLTFKFATAVLRYTTKGYDQDLFGKLDSISVWNGGAAKAGSWNAATKKHQAVPYLTYSEGARLAIDTTKLEDTTPTWPMRVDTTGLGAAGAGSHELKIYIGEKTAGTAGQIGSGLIWNDKAVAPAAIALADRSNLATGTIDSITSMMHFDKIDLTKVREWGNEIAEMTNDGVFNGITFNINEDFDYLVTKGYKTTSGEKKKGYGRTMMVYAKGLSNAFKKVGQSDSIVWEDSNDDSKTPNGYLKPEKIDTLIIYKYTGTTKEGNEMTDDDWKMLKKMTNLKRLVIEEVTSIPAQALKGLKNLKTLELPEVTEIADANAFECCLDTVIMPKYTFETRDINNALLKTNYLKYLDMGASELGIGFTDAGLILQGYGALRYVKMSYDGEVTLRANAFMDCDSLTKVESIRPANMTGTSVFAGDTSLVYVNIKNNIIPDNAFRNCRNLPTTGLLIEGAAISKPTSVGKMAFAGTKKINLDLAECTTLGDSAFLDATGLKGGVDKVKKTTVLHVAAETIPAGAFKGCSSLEYVYFMKATTIGNLMLANSDTGLDPIRTNENNTRKNMMTNLKNIKFGAAFDVTKKVDDGTFGNGTASNGETTYSTLRIFKPATMTTGFNGQTLTMGNSTDGKTKHAFSMVENEDNYTVE